MSEELKPCPFCGGDAIKVRHEGLLSVQCSNQNCFAGDNGKWGLDYEDDLISMWNTRLVDGLTEMVRFNQESGQYDDTFNPMVKEGE